MEREKQRQRILPSAGLPLRWSQEQHTSWRTPTWVIGDSVLRTSRDDFLCVLVGSWIESRTARTVTGARRAGVNDKVVLICCATSSALISTYFYII